MIPPTYLLTIEQAAKSLAISRRTLEREIHHGRFPKPVRIGDLPRIPVSDLEAYVRLLATDAAREPYLRANPIFGALAHWMDAEMLRRINKAMADSAERFGFADGANI